MKRNDAKRLKKNLDRAYMQVRKRWYVESPSTPTIFSTGMK